MSLRNLFNRRTPAEPLVGKWRLIRSEGDIDQGGGVELEFFPNGRLEYRIEDNGKIGIIKLTYKVAGNTIVTDQPSAPRQERSDFRFEANGTLVLSNPSSTTWFERVLN